MLWITWDGLAYGLFGLWVAVSALKTYGTWWFLGYMLPCPALATLPRVLVITPVKNVGPYLADFFARLRSQDYAAARVVVVVEARADPAYAVACIAAEGAGLPMEVRVAGLSATAGQKVWNLTKALEAVEEADEIVVFIDADTLPSRTWLRRLVAPMANNMADATGGYRWLFPFGRNLSGLLIAASDHGIASVPRWRRWNAVWGGTFAIRRRTLAKLRIEDWWRGAVSDDLQMTRALWAHGLRVVYPVGMLVATPVSHTLASAFEFGRRQYVIARTHLVRYALLLILFPVAAMLCVTLALAYAVTGDRVAIAALAAVFALSQWRHAMRMRIERTVCDEAGATIEDHSLATRVLASLLAPVLNFVCILASFTSRRIRWSGVDYEIVAPQDVRVTRPTVL